MLQTSGDGAVPQVTQASHTAGSQSLLGKALPAYY